MSNGTATTADVVKRLIKNFVWLLILVDFVILLWVGIQEPEIFQALADQTKLLISAVVWGLAFLGLVVGGILKSGFSDVDQFLENARVQIAVVFLTAVLLYAYVDREDLIQLTATVIVRVVPDWRTSATEPVKGNVELTVAGVEQPYKDRLLLSDSTVFSKVPPNRSYRAVFKPDDTMDVSGGAEKSATILRGRNVIELPIQRVRYGSARFVIDCGSSGHPKLVPGAIRIMKDGQDVARAKSLELVRLRVGQYVAIGTAQQVGASQIFHYRGEGNVLIQSDVADMTVVIKAKITHP
jgi:hypothetical protein